MGLKLKIAKFPQNVFFLPLSTPSWANFRFIASIVFKKCVYMPIFSFKIFAPDFEEKIAKIAPIINIRVNIP